MKKDALKYCPFCSSSRVRLDRAGYWFLNCLDCKVVVHFYHSGARDKEDVILRWNIRAQTLEDCANVQKLKNERGAGRKPKLNRQEKEKIKVWRKRGMTYRRIAEHMGLSVGTVHKIISEQKKQEVVNA
ncbi:MAG: helix-turn-helix domain-containing protein [Defluviitaleaceae bacterium]|nr:helix-turn-helix domain-containing protein [Defluviitaleaceae bacterium]